MRTTAIFSYKGGTGKTTTAINLGAELAARGKRVLIIDADGQRNTSEFFAVDEELGTIYEVLTASELYYKNLIQRTRWDNLDVLPASTELATIELQALKGGQMKICTSIMERATKSFA